ncbi:MAG TPA: hypothetical protein PLZ43_08680 [bacterium]|nr:hypothetical protein [bacterium]
MNRITSETTLKELAFIVGKALKDCSIDAVLVGGAVVSIYSDNKYQSSDLDFISSDSVKSIETALLKIGFKKNGRYFQHDDTEFFVEFPPSPVSIGNHIVREFRTLEDGQGYLRLLPPTYSVMDRLASFYFWNDWQSLDQAVLISKHQKIDFSKIKQWSQEEGELEKYEMFLQKLK